MLTWSRYNRVYRWDSTGSVIYNALSNRLTRVPAKLESQLSPIEADPMGYDFSHCVPLFLEMIKNKVLVGENGDDDGLNALRAERRAACQDTSQLDLTVLVTEKCNFGCPYCYEKHAHHQEMSPQTMERLLEFIENAAPERLKIIWFGGEPLLRFDIIQTLTSRVTALGIPFSAGLITNGWLLTPEVTNTLDSLNIEMIQVTVDGPPQIHNQRRFHLKHGNSFQVIQSNLDRLMRTEQWQGLLKINMVVDHQNTTHYKETHAHWAQRYKGSRVTVGANFTDGTEPAPSRRSNAFSRREKIAFYLEHFKDHGGEGLKYLPHQSINGCNASHDNAFVIGADGRVYKCWDDIGKEEMVVGSIHQDRREWNDFRIRRYCRETDPFEAPACRECFHLPICNPCPNIRYRQQFKGQDISACPLFKDHLGEFLEIHQKLKPDARKKAQPKHP